MIELDGSHGEGGGAILRQALALSIHTGEGFKISNIRANRPDPGLKMQHLKALNLAHQISNAKVTGNSLGSTEVSFEPGKLQGKNVKVDVQTAGSLTLLLQSVMLPCVLSDQKFKISLTGGTDVKWSASYDYFASVFIPHLRKYADVNVELQKRGYYPKGQGLINVEIKGKGESKPINLVEKNTILQIRGVSHSSKELEDVADRQARNAEVLLTKYGPVRIDRQYVTSASTGSGITLWAIYGDDEIDFHNPIRLGASALGEPRKKAEIVGEEAAQELIKEIESDAAVDRHLCDQLIPFLAVVGGSIKTSEITDHTRSNIYVAEKFGFKFEVDDLAIKA